MTPTDIKSALAETLKDDANICTAFSNADCRTCEAVDLSFDEFVRALMKRDSRAVIFFESERCSGFNTPVAAVSLEDNHRNACNSARGRGRMYTRSLMPHHLKDEQQNTSLTEISTPSPHPQVFGVTGSTGGSLTLAQRTTVTRDGERSFVDGKEMWTSCVTQVDLTKLPARKPMFGFEAGLRNQAKGRLRESQAGWFKTCHVWIEKPSVVDRAEFHAVQSQSNSKVELRDGARHQKLG